MTKTKIKQRVIELIEQERIYGNAKIVSLSEEYEEVSVAFVTDNGIVCYVVEFHYQKDYSRVVFYPCFYNNVNSYLLGKLEKIAENILKDGE